MLPSSFSSSSTIGSGSLFFLDFRLPPRLNFFGGEVGVSGTSFVSVWECCDCWVNWRFWKSVFREFCCWLSCQNFNAWCCWKSSWLDIPNWFGLSQFGFDDEPAYGFRHPLRRFVSESLLLPWDIFLAIRSVEVNIMSCGSVEKRIVLNGYLYWLEKGFIIYLFLFF